MKKKLKHLNCIIILLMMLLLPNTMLSIEANNSQTVILQKKPVKKEHNQELDREGTRMPSRPIVCTISDQGVQSEIPTEDIISYELWDAVGSCLLYVPDDKEFVYQLYSFPQEEYELRITTDEYVYIGYVSI